MEAEGKRIRKLSAAHTHSDPTHHVSTRTCACRQVRFRDACAFVVIRHIIMTPRDVFELDATSTCFKQFEDTHKFPRDGCTPSTNSNRTLRLQRTGFVRGRGQVRKAPSATFRGTVRSYFDSKGCKDALQTLGVDVRTFVLQIFPFSGEDGKTPRGQAHSANSEKNHESAQMPLGWRASISIERVRAIRWRRPHFLLLNIIIGCVYRGVAQTYAGISASYSPLQDSRTGMQTTHAAMFRNQTRFDTRLPCPVTPH